MISLQGRSIINYFCCLATLFLWFVDSGENIEHVSFKWYLWNCIAYIFYTSLSLSNWNGNTHCNEVSCQVTIFSSFAYFVKKFWLFPRYFKMSGMWYIWIFMLLMEKVFFWVPKGVDTFHHCFKTHRSCKLFRENVQFEVSKYSHWILGCLLILLEK